MSPLAAKCHTRNRRLDYTKTKLKNSHSAVDSFVKKELRDFKQVPHEHLNIIFSLSVPCDIISLRCDGGIEATTKRVDKSRCGLNEMALIVVAVVLNING